MFATGVVRDMSVNHSARSGGIIGIYFRFSLIRRYALCSNEYIQYTIFNRIKNTQLTYPKSAAMGFFKGLEKEFETVVINEPQASEGLLYHINFSKYTLFECLYFTCVSLFRSVFKISVAF